MCRTTKKTNIWLGREWGSKIDSSMDQMYTPHKFSWFRFSTPCKYRIMYVSKEEQKKQQKKKTKPIYQNLYYVLRYQIYSKCIAVDSQSKQENNYKNYEKFSNYAAIFQYMNNVCGFLLFFFRFWVVLSSELSNFQAETITNQMVFAISNQKVTFAIAISPDRHDSHQKHEKWKTIRLPDVFEYIRNFLYAIFFHIFFIRN